MNNKNYLNACFKETEGIIRRKMHNPRDFYFVYKLKLRDDKYYLGQTQNIYAALYQHKNGQGSNWTSTHQYVDVVSIAAKCTKDSDLKHLTLVAMREHGWNNVRSSKYNRAMIRMPPELVHYAADEYEVRYEMMSEGRLAEIRQSLDALDNVELEGA